MAVPLRLRCKVIRHEGKEYLVPMAIKTSYEQIMTFAMSEEDTIQLVMSVVEYNELPYRWFVDTGPAPHREEPWGIGGTKR